MNKFEKRAPKAYWLTVLNRQSQRPAFWRDLGFTAIVVALSYFGILFLFGG